MKPAPRKYVFRRPLWRILTPVLFIGIVWSIPYVWNLILERNLIPPQAHAYISMIEQWLRLHGLKIQHMTATGCILTVLLFYWFLKGLQALVLTQEGLYRSYGLFRTRMRPWDDMMEIRIDRIIHRLEDHRSTTRRLVLKFRPEVSWLWSPVVKIDNNTYPEYPFAEAIAVRTGVSHMARRFYRATIQSGTPVTFPPVSALIGFPSTLILWAIAAGLIKAAGTNSLWVHPMLTHFPMLLFVAAAVLVLLGIDAFFYRQIGCDGRDLLIMRRSFVRKRIPIAALDLNRIDVHINSLKIYARLRKNKQPVCVYSTNSYLRNRAVLLCMLRSIYEYLRRQHLESQMSNTQRMKNIIDLSPTFLSEDEEGNVESIPAEPQDQIDNEEFSPGYDKQEDEFDIEDNSAPEHTDVEVGPEEKDDFAPCDVEHMESPSVQDEKRQDS